MGFRADALPMFGKDLRVVLLEAFPFTSEAKTLWSRRKGHACCLSPGAELKCLHWGGKQAVWRREEEGPGGPGQTSLTPSSPPMSSASLKIEVDQL